MSACAPESLRIAISSEIALRPRTQLPNRSVACGASHSWLTWAPASDKPTAQCGSLNNAATSSTSSLARMQRARNASSGSSSARSSSTSNGVTPRCCASSLTRRPSSSGCAGLCAISKVSHRGTVKPGLASHSAIAFARQLALAYASRRSGIALPINSAKFEFMLNVNGAASVSAKTSGRGVICGHTCAPLLHPA